LAGKEDILKKFDQFVSFIKNKKVALVGLGISNTPLIDFLLRGGALVSAHDKKTEAEFDSDFISSLKDKNIKLFLGKDYLNNFDEDIIIKAPGIRRDAGALPLAVERGAVLTSEMELFFKISGCEKLAITGSDGKTTTTTLTYLMMCEHYKDTGRTVYVGGNIGKPLLSQVEEIKDSDIAVLELSSFQLHAMEIAPDAAVITNISPNHLDWHTDYNEYIDSKRRIFSFMESGIIVLNYINDITRTLADDASADVEVRFFTSGNIEEIPEKYTAVYKKDGKIFVRDAKLGESVFIMNESDIVVPGKHNIENYMTAIALLYGRVDNTVFGKIATSFGGVEHRIEFVRELDGVKYYNSSIDSSPSRTMAALNSFDKKVIAIMGGYDKNIPYDVMGDCVCTHTRAVVLTGATAEKIKSAIENSKEAKSALPDIYVIDNFEKAVNKAREIAKEGEAVILTPASASFDKFKNFEVRGNFFKDIVNKF